MTPSRNAELRTHAIDQQMREPKSAFPETPVLLVLFVVAVIVVCLTGGPQP